jgi:hypothetical protein
VKAHFVHRLPVHLRFRTGDAGKYIQRPLLRPRADSGPFNNPPDLPPATVRMPFAVGMSVCAVPVDMLIIIVFVFVVMMMVRRFRFAGLIIKGDVIVRDVIRFPFQLDNRVEAVYAPPFIIHKIQFPARKAEFNKFAAKLIRVRAQMHQRAQGHIARNSGGKIKVQGFHESILVNHSKMINTAAEKAAIRLIALRRLFMYTVFSVHSGGN